MALSGFVHSAFEVVYYRVKVIGQDNEVAYSDVMTLHRMNQFALDINAWPVPADDRLTVTFAEAKAGTLLEVVDVSGKLVFQQAISEDLKKEASMEMDTRNWSNGIYLLRMKDASGKFKFQRLVIQH
ncbi:MAG: T9SS type A sorting domain-containing protein [Bacteroidetes bacterium]|nr:T9SS type A sorting domain-containing protein [Bacteroidota bacterium]